MTDARTLRPLPWRAEWQRVGWIAGGGALGYALIELVATFMRAPGGGGAGVWPRLALLHLGLTALVWLGAGLGLGLIATGWRLTHGGRSLWRVRAVDGPRPEVARVIAALVVGALAVIVTQRFAQFVIRTYKEPQLAAALVSVVAIGLMPLWVAMARPLRRGVSRLAGGAHPRLGPRLRGWSPLARWRGLLLACAVLGTGVVILAWVASPAARAVLDDRGRVRMLVSLAGFVAGAAVAVWSWEREVARGRRPTSRAKRLVAGLAVGALVPLALIHWGARAEIKYTLVTASPINQLWVDWIRRANDFDGDGFGTLLGENDCAPHDAALRPGVRDLPDNDIDENCDGRDFSLRDLAPPPGPSRPLPKAFERPWNVLFVTIDTVRYDHTTFGGYATGPRKRDTTPELAALVNRASNFTFAQAPSAGTMASIPALLTSKFFHSGIALDETKKVPKLKPENFLMSEAFKAAGYATGAITSHEYFNDWGMDQGVDNYDNSIGKKANPFSITSAESTDRAIAWISKQVGKRWYLWTHYIDPHGRYVDHPTGPRWGSTEEDLYDGELRFTDQELGRLLRELPRLPGGDRTIVVVTSDHGDGFGEHGFINHGQALYRELIHVPLIIYVPDNPPRSIGGAVSGLDVFPTLAEICRLDVDGHTFEGKSLVPQIFYGDEDPARVVFAETNYPQPIRAAVSSTHKLVFHLKNNLFEFYDLAKDPWEKSNLAASRPAAMGPMRDAIEAWLSRVLYARDATFNQAAAKMADLLLPARPTPLVATAGVSFDQGAVEVLGLGWAKGGAPKPKAKFTPAIYLEVKAAPQQAWRLQFIFWPVAPGADPMLIPSLTARTPPRATLDGLFPADRWRPGEFIREQFVHDIPATWRGDRLAIGLVVMGEDGKRVDIPGTPAVGEPKPVFLGTLPFDGGPVETPITPPATPIVPAKPAVPTGAPPRPVPARGSPPPPRP